MKNMVKNFEDNGHTVLNVRNSSGATYLAGVPLRIGAFFGVPVVDIPDVTVDADKSWGAVNTIGTYEFAKQSGDAFAPGATVYWDDNNSRCSLDPQFAVLGVCAEDAPSGTGLVTCKVSLNARPMPPHVRSLLITATQSTAAMIFRIPGVTSSANAPRAIVQAWDGAGSARSITSVVPSVSTPGIVTYTVTASFVNNDRLVMTVPSSI